MSVAKSHSIVKAVAAIELGLAFVVSTIAFTYVFGIGNIVVVALITYGGILAIERGRSDFKQSLEISKGRTFKDDRKGVLAGATKLGIGYKKITSIPFLLGNMIIMVALLGTELYLFSRMTSEFVGINVGLLIPVVTIIVHLLLIRPLFLRSGFTSRMEKKLPQVAIVSNGLKITLLVGNARNQHKLPAPVIVKFSEIDSMSIQNAQQVNAMKDFEIGQDVDLAARHAKDMFLFMRKKIDRPRVFYMPVDNAFTTHITIQGTDLLYVLAVPKDQAEAALAAWKKR